VFAAGEATGEPFDLGVVDGGDLVIVGPVLDTRVVLEELAVRIVQCSTDRQALRIP
jgi:hypothetical protein